MFIIDNVMRRFREVTNTSVNQMDNGEYSVININPKEIRRDAQKENRQHVASTRLELLFN